MARVASVPPGKFVRYALVALVLVVLALAYRFGVFAEVSDPRRLARTLVRWGAWGYLVFILAYAVLQPFGVPGTVFVLAAPLIWPWPAAFAVSMAGTMLASVVGFSFARFVARAWVSARIPARFRKYDAAIERNAFGTVVALRFIFWMPQYLHAFFGVSRVPFWTHFWGSFLGYVPPLLALSYLGSEIIDADGNLQPRVWPITGAFLGVTALVVAVLRHRSRRRSA